MGFVYSAYGLTLQSNIAIPGLVARVDPPVLIDLQVHLGGLPAWFLQLSADSKSPWYLSQSRDEAGRPWLTIQQVKTTHLHITYLDHTEFFLDRSGTEIWGQWPDNLTLEDTATYLLGPILGLVLSLRGQLCLHASAIAIAGQAIVLVGKSGMGKSTTAAALARLGYPILADDVVVLTWQQQQVWVQPGYPYLRLWADSVSALYGSETALPRLTPNWDKQYLDLQKPGYQFQRLPLPLTRIYLLAPRQSDPAAPTLNPLSAQAALIQLVANSYTAYLLDKTMRAREFDQLSRLITQVPIKAIVPHQEISYLSQLCDIILQDSLGAERG